MSEPFLGEFEDVQIGVDADGEPVFARRVKRHATHTTGFDVDRQQVKARPLGSAVDHE